MLFRCNQMNMMASWYASTTNTNALTALGSSSLTWLPEMKHNVAAAKTIVDDDKTERISQGYSERCSGIVFLRLC